MIVEEDNFLLVSGDCRDIVGKWPKNYVDAIVTDPPYELWNKNLAGRKNCLSGIVHDIVFPKYQDCNIPVFGQDGFALPSFEVSFLDWINWPIGIESGVAVPKGSVHFDSDISTEKIETTGESTSLISDGELSFERDSKIDKFLGNYILDFTNFFEFTTCNGLCGCFGESGFGSVCMPISTVQFPLETDFLSILPESDLSRFGIDIGLFDDSFGQSHASSEIMAFGRTKDSAMLTLNLAGRTGELLFTDRTNKGLALTQFSTAEDIRTISGASGLSSEFEAFSISVVDDKTNGTLTLYIHSDIISRIKQKSSGGFMGKSWDNTGVSFDPETWSAMLRILKPGGYLLAFGGSRTYHRIAVAIEDAGFELRDTIMWLYGQGMPKSLDISKAIDKTLGAKREKVQPGNQPAYQRSIGNHRPYMDDPDHKIDGSDPVTAAAAAWNGWGTNLKPAFEPILVVRKPLAEKNVALNVLEYSTGGINIDGCRIEAHGCPSRETHPLRDDVEYNPTSLAGRVDGSLQSSKAVGVTDQGRWPANVILSHTTECEEIGTYKTKARVINRFTDGAKPFGGGAGHEYESIQLGDENGMEEVPVWECHSDCPIRLLDEQTGTLTSGKANAFEGEYKASVYGKFAHNTINPETIYADSGGASRFFYCSKASPKERHAGLEDKNPHPTVKPIDLMRYLVRMVTPPGGVVLDPFCGSGSTGVAALSEGFDFIGLDLSDENISTSEARIRHWIEPK